MKKALISAVSHNADTAARWNTHVSLIYIFRSMLYINDPVIKNEIAVLMHKQNKY